MWVFLHECKLCPPPYTWFCACVCAHPASACVRTHVCMCAPTAVSRASVSDKHTGRTTCVLGVTIMKRTHRAHFSSRAVINANPCFPCYCCYCFSVKSQKSYDCCQLNYCCSHDWSMTAEQQTLRCGDTPRLKSRYIYIFPEVIFLSCAEGELSCAVCLKQLVSLLDAWQRNRCSFPVSPRELTCLSACCYLIAPSQLRWGNQV